MGCGLSSDCMISVYTGDRKNAGTDANVKVILHDQNGNFTEEIPLDNLFTNDHESGHADTFHVMRLPIDFGNVARVEFWRDNFGAAADWYVQKIIVNVRSRNSQHVFPVHRWIKADFHYIILELDTSLPQDDPEAQQRRVDLDEVRTRFEYTQKGPGVPVQVGLLGDSWWIDISMAFCFMKSGL